MTLPYDITEPRDALIVILGEQWKRGVLDIPTLCEVVVKFDRWSRTEARKKKSK